jgi:hypothetical protein
VSEPERKCPTQTRLLNLILASLGALVAREPLFSAVVILAVTARLPTGNRTEGDKVP